MTPPQTEQLDDLAAFDAHLSRHDNLRGCVLQSLDLRERSSALGAADPRGALFLGCDFAPGDDDLVRRRGALVFPKLPEIPFDSYQPRLYVADDLYDRLDEGYDACLDARIYAWHLAQGARPGLDATLATSLHDHAISDGIDEWWAARQDEADGGCEAIGVMGGHALQRGTEGYASAARLAGELTRGGRVVATGGGPGAMEAANLGAWLAHSPEALDEALELLASAPDFHTDLTAWARTAAEVRRRWPATAETLGIPTWFYGHEPPNQFGTGIAKYFSNAIREDILLQRCRAGIVYLPGAAGTVQEIFQAATGTYYAADDLPTTPLVLVDVGHWTQKLPAWPLLEALGRERRMGAAVHLVDSIEEAAQVLLS